MACVLRYHGFQIYFATKDVVTLRDSKWRLLEICLETIKPGCVLVNPLKGIYFQLLSPLNVKEIGTPATRKLFVDPGSACDMRGCVLDLPSGIDIDWVRFPTQEELDTYERFNTI